MEITGNTFIVTGGAQGSGKAIGSQLAAKGGRVALVDMNEEVLEKAVIECRLSGSWQAESEGQLSR